MPTDPYFRMQSYSLGQIQVSECEIEHGCCHACDGCDGGKWETLEGPCRPVMFGPWPDNSPWNLNGMFKAVYGAKLIADLVPAGGRS